RIADARNWLKQVGTSLDGIIAKRRDMPYESGNRHGMQKIKNYRSADCVVGGFRYDEGRRTVGSLLLDLYDEQGLLNHVGFTSSLEKKALTAKLEKLVAAPGFTARAVGRRNVRRSGSRLSRSLWSRSVTTTSVGAVFVTARSCCAGDRTRRRGNAPWTRSIGRKRIW